jgi:transketolase
VSAGASSRDEQPPEYRDAVLPPDVVARVAIETGTSLGWHRWVGPRGRVLSVDRFGASAPGPEVARRYGFTADQVVATALEVLA